MTKLLMTLKIVAEEKDDHEILLWCHFRSILNYDYRMQIFDSRGKEEGEVN